MPGTTDLIFAPMVEADLAAVVEIERQSFPKPWTTGLFLQELRLDFSRQTVGRTEPDGPIAGYACWWVVAGEVHILNVAVRPSGRGRGIGASLVSRILADGEAAGATVVGLEVRADNAAALALYSRCGFARVGERRDYYGPGVDAVLMDCQLPARTPKPQMSTDKH